MHYEIESSNFPLSAFLLIQLICFACSLGVVPRGETANQKTASLLLAWVINKSSALYWEMRCLMQFMKLKQNLNEKRWASLSCVSGLHKEGCLISCVARLCLHVYGFVAYFLATLKKISDVTNAICAFGTFCASSCSEMSLDCLLLFHWLLLYIWCLETLNNCATLWVLFEHILTAFVLWNLDKIENMFQLRLMSQTENITKYFFFWISLSKIT